MGCAALHPSYAGCFRHCVRIPAIQALMRLHCYFHFHPRLILCLLFKQICGDFGVFSTASTARFTRRRSRSRGTGSYAFSLKISPSNSKHSEQTFAWNPATIFLVSSCPCPQKEQKTFFVPVSSFFVPNDLTDSGRSGESDSTSLIRTSSFACSSRPSHSYVSRSVFEGTVSPLTRNNAAFPSPGRASKACMPLIPSAPATQTRSPFTQTS
jgi:hypothetical protein